MRARFSNLFWGIVIILLGTLLLLKANGILKGDVFGYFWPLLLMMFGLWIFLGYFVRPGDSELGSGFTLDLGGAREAEIRFSNGAGQVEITGGTPAGVLADGNAGAGMSVSNKMDGALAKVRIESGPTFIPFIGPGEGVWRFRLSEAIPLSLKVESGASNLHIDLSNLKVKAFKLETGASSVQLNLPQKAEGMIVDINGGATSINVTVPQGLEARIKVTGVLALNLDQARFPRQTGGYYESAGYAASTNRVDISAEGGAGSINIR